MSLDWSLVLACDAGYALPTAVCLRSIDIHLSDPPTAVYILTDGVSHEDQRLIRGQFHSAPVEFVTAAGPLHSFSAHDEAAHVTPTMFLKCVAPQILTESANTLVYLDSDTLVLGDLSELARTAIGNRTVGMVIDRYVSDNVIDPGPHPYYNSGVILVDRARWNETQITEKVLDEISARADVLHYPDQDALNKVLRGTICTLDKRWNYMVGETVKNDPTTVISCRPEESAVLHLCGPTKPWRTKLAQAQLQAVYDQYLALLAPDNSSRSGERDAGCAN